ncbi:hypothetical protein ASZ90_006416 [hydrocarbon metagenome]|uniref:Prepilin-type N-terminal cleavage/methylation domain-containing protein n=1 Tax=hydrocarbon metagenome TaxID=938273 RepID=A0A0W8FSA4_9ZZZZ
MRVLNFNKKTGEKGFTLFELMIALGISVFIMAAIYASVNMAQRSSASVTRRVTTQQDARAVLDIMAMEIRMASFNPKPPATGSTWSTIPYGENLSLTTVPSVSNKGIQIAGANQIHISMDLNSDGIIGDVTKPDGSKVEVRNEYILYTYDSTKNAIYRNVSNGNNQPVLGGNDNAETKVINDETTPLFQYFDRDGSPAALIKDIRRIRITIIARTKIKDMLTGNVRVIPYTTDVLVKNHVLSP